MEFLDLKLNKKKSLMRLSHLYSLPLTELMYVYSLMDRLDQERLTQWKVRIQVCYLIQLVLNCNLRVVFCLGQLFISLKRWKKSISSSIEVNLLK